MLAYRFNFLMTTAVKCGVFTVQGVDFFLPANKKLLRKQLSLNSFVQKCNVTDGVLLLISVDQVGTSNTNNVNNLTWCADKTKYMIMSRDQNARRSHSMKTDNSSIERAEEFKYLGTTLTNKNYIQEENKSRLKLGND